MKRFTVLLAVCLGVVVLLHAAVANASVLNTRPVTVLPGSEQSLNSILNDLTTDSPPGIHVSGPLIDVTNDQTPYAVFTNQASGGAVATMIIEVAGWMDTNSFGLYKFGDTSNQALIFAGSANAGDQALVSFMANGDIEVNGDVAATGFGNVFGFYLTTPNTTWYSEDDQNAGEAHALVYQGNNATTLQLPGYAAGLFSSDEWIIAWEDTALGSSDKDYNDMVLAIESIQPVPEPATIIVWSLLGTLVTAVGWWRLRKAA